MTSDASVNTVTRKRGWTMRRIATRMASFAVLATALLLSGDRVMSQSGQVKGLDPLDVLDFQQLPNVLFLVDTSNTMGKPLTGAATDTTYWTGGDDVLSRLYQVKVAIRNSIKASAGKANFGVGQVGPANSAKRIKLTGIKTGGATDVDKGPFIYVSVDANLAISAINDGDSAAGRPPVDSPFLYHAMTRLFTPNLLNAPAGLRSTPPSNTALATDYDWKDDATLTACPAFCEYRSDIAFPGNTTTCPTYCENEFLRSFIATENGFGTPYTTTPGVGTFSSARVLDDIRAGNPGDRFYLKSRVFLNQVLFKWATGPGDNTVNGDAFVNANGLPAAKIITRGLKEIRPIGPERTVAERTDRAGVVNSPCGTAGSASTVIPAGLLADDILDTNDGLTNRPCFQIELEVGNTVRATRKKRATFYLVSGGFGQPSPCVPGIAPPDNILPCSHPASADTTPSLTFGTLKMELPIGTVPLPTGLSMPWPPLSYVNTNPNSSGGIQIAGDVGPDGDNTPIAQTLDAARLYYNTSVFPLRPASAAGKQKNIIILIVDGDESQYCTVPVGDPVAAAQRLYNNAPTPDNRIETVVVAFPGAASALANQIARAGSGNTRDAYSGGNLPSNLAAAVTGALAQVNSGTFSAADTTVTESVFEFYSPNDPTGRYNFSQPIVFQPSFTMPGWAGHLGAFYNPGTGVATARWPGANDAGAKLLERVASIPAGGATFSELTGGATIKTIASSSALLKRRVLTTTRNGVFTPASAGGAFFDVTKIISRADQPEVMGLYPPDPTIDPVVSSLGVLDDEFGLPIVSTYVAATFTTLQTTYGACAGAPLPAGHACLGTGGTAAQKNLAMGTAIKEAREALIAYIGGALVKGGLTPQRNTTGGLLFVGRPWILAETTLSSPAVVTGPLQSEPAATHLAEYKMFRDGPRNTAGRSENGISQGFGLRHPDRDGDLTTKANAAIKPAMSLVMIGSNEGLHAFRAGPNCDQAVGTCTETGGEELWSFVPHDQLDKIPLRFQPFGRDPHPYMIASGLRFGEVFVPHYLNTGFSVTVGSTTVTGAGVWRTVMVFGRGIGGKYYTALDVTAPGPYTEPALETDLPLVYWSRGNPDTLDGTTAGTKVITSTTLDYDAYLRMGETWSVPALAFVNPANFINKKSKLGDTALPCVYTSTSVSNATRRPNPPGTEFVFYTGSGYSTVAQEGSSVYALDALTGDVLMVSDVCDRNPLPLDTTKTPAVSYQNGVVANPVVYSARQLSNDDTDPVGNSARGYATRVYVSDIHGRLWKFNTTNTGVAVQVDDLNVGPGAVAYGPQPVSNAAALLSLNSDGAGIKPHIYLETGGDKRHGIDVTKPFRMFGYRDDAPDGEDITPSLKFTQLFTIPFPTDASVTPPIGFRGTAQPATVFNTAGQGRVFFLGTKFKPAQVDCVTTFDSILFSVSAAAGLQAYDSGLSYTMSGQKGISVRVDRGEVVVDKGLNVGNLPSAPAVSANVPGASGTGEVFVRKTTSGSSVCH